MFDEDKTQKHVDLDLLVFLEPWYVVKVDELDFSHEEVNLKRNRAFNLRLKEETTREGWGKEARALRVPDREMPLVEITPKNTSKTERTEIQTLHELAL